MPPLLLYDGHCALCNTLLRWVLRFDAQQQFRFASLQSAYGKQHIQEHAIPADTDSLVLIADQKAYTHHLAVFKTLSLLGYPLKAFCIFQFLPNQLNYTLYKYIAKNRYKWFGKYDSCPLPPQKNRKQFLGN